jgi:hypothetical protein
MRQLSPWESNLEELLYGLLDGMSFKKNEECYSGLVSAIYYAFDALENKDVYNPTKTLKFVISS